MERLQAVLDRFEISIAAANDLVILEDYEIVIVADDSGSMQWPASMKDQQEFNIPPTSAMTSQQDVKLTMATIENYRKSGRLKTRWDELKETIALMVEIGNYFDASGVDIFFLNRGELLRVKGAHDPALVKCFAALPSGGTPLTATLEKVQKRCDGEKPVLLFVLTDGVPDGGVPLCEQRIRSMVAATNPRIKLQVMACTGDDNEIEWLNRLDHHLKEVDVTDDYFTERQQVMLAGKCPAFSRGDWVMKAMLGPISEKFDAWDEKAKEIPSGTGITACCAECSLM